MMPWRVSYRLLLHNGMMMVLVCKLDRGLSSKNIEYTQALMWLFALHPASV